jgi:SHS2 domain-containing protein
MKIRGHETLEHTADMGLRGWGGTPAEAFEETALAMFDLMIDRRVAGAEKGYTLSIGGRDLTGLLIEFLNELLSLADVEETAFVTVSIERLEGCGEDWELEAVIGGIPREKCGKRLLSEVKAATWYGASVDCEKDGLWVAGCVVDL